MPALNGMELALNGVSVLDLSSRAAGGWCTRLLADFGADVVMVESPRGHALRGRGAVRHKTSAMVRYLSAGGTQTIGFLARYARWSDAG